MHTIRGHAHTTFMATHDLFFLNKNISASSNPRPTRVLQGTYKRSLQHSCSSWEGKQAGLRLEKTSLIPRGTASLRPRCSPLPTEEGEHHFGAQGPRIQAQVHRDGVDAWATTRITQQVNRQAHQAWLAQHGSYLTTAPGSVIEQWTRKHAAGPRGSSVLHQRDDHDEGHKG